MGIIPEDLLLSALVHYVKGRLPAVVTRALSSGYGSRGRRAGVARFTPSGHSPCPSQLTPQGLQHRLQRCHHMLGSGVPEQFLLVRVTRVAEERDPGAPGGVQIRGGVTDHERLRRIRAEGVQGPVEAVRVRLEVVEVPGTAVE